MRSLSKRSLPPLAVALLGALVLGACSSPAPPSASVPAGVATPVPVPGADLPSTPQLAELRPLGVVNIAFAGQPDGTFTARQVPQSDLEPQALTARSGIQLEPVSNGSFTVGQRGAGGMRYLYVTFRVRNAAQNGAAYTDARSNLTLVAASTPTTSGETAIGSLTRFDGSAASAAVAPTILPTHAMTLNRATDLPKPLAGGEDLQVFAEQEVSAVPAGAVRLFPYGFVVRHKTNTGSRTLAASPAVGQFDGLVTLAVKIPLQPTVADDPFGFTVSFEAMDDSLTRVTESVEEQGVGSEAAARAAALGVNTPVVTLCGSSVTGSTALFVGSATTAGNTARLARVGGDLALKSPLSALNAIGNTRLNVAAASGLAAAYSVYAGATPSFSGTATSTRGGNVSVDAAGNVIFRPKVGDGTPAVTDRLTYRVTDNRTCSSPDTNVDVNVAGRVWYVNNSGSNGDGRQDTPFNTLAAAQTASGTGDTLYVARGNATTSGQNAGIVLKNNQVLTGEAAALTVGATTILAAGSNPSLIGHAGGVGVTLAQNNTVRGLGITGQTAGVSGSNFGTFTASALSAGATAGPALTLTGGVLAASFTRLDSAASPSNGLTLSDVGGNLTVSGTGTASSGGTLSGAALSGVSIQPQNRLLSVSLSRMRLQNNAGLGVDYRTLPTQTGRAHLVVTNNVFANNASTAMQFRHDGQADAQVTFDDNTVSNTTSQGGGLTYRSAHATSQADQGYVRRNQITLNPAGAANGVSLFVDGLGTARFVVDSNTVSGYGSYGLDFAAKEKTGRLDVTATNNTASTPGGFGLDSMSLQSGSGTPGENNTLCANVSGNIMRGNLTDPSTFGIYLWQVGSNPLALQGLTGSGTNSGNVAAFVAGRNMPSTVFAQTTNVTTLTCTLPTF
ncbi:VcbS [Deinococcus sp. QL22]|uniref:VcbS n=1 Tax=Deinococcus sp. QL22 TaxID=2939437 RepID=UPI002016E24E|nr:VcbS [Deinococcus sp. QL22]UQN09594.1 VcbS [Deinococcus sp. QL22]